MGNTTGYESTIFSKKYVIVDRVLGRNTTVPFDNLDPETEYYVAVRAVNKIGGTLVYGPHSRKFLFMTTPLEIPSPSKLEATNVSVKSNDTYSAVTFRD